MDSMRLYVRQMVKPPPPGGTFVRLVTAMSSVGAPSLWGPSFCAGCKAEVAGDEEGGNTEYTPRFLRGRRKGPPSSDSTA